MDKIDKGIIIMQLLTDEQLNHLKCLSSHNIEAYNFPKETLSCIKYLISEKYAKHIPSLDGPGVYSITEAGKSYLTNHNCEIKKIKSLEELHDIVESLQRDNEIMEKHLEEVRETNKTLESRNDTLQKQVEEIQEMNKILKESSESSSKHSKIAIVISLVSVAITIFQLCIQLISR